MNCEIDNSVLEKISTEFSKSIGVDYHARRYGIEKCVNCTNYNYAYDLYMLYTRSLERDNCNMCTEGYCCTTQIEERINTL